MADQQAGQSVQHSFQVPKRLVKTPEDLDKWPTSQVVADYSQHMSSILGVVLQINHTLEHIWSRRPGSHAGESDPQD